jgi:selenocysteine lyase/cysteine desulfurase
MTAATTQSDWTGEFEFEPGVVFLNHASFGPVTRRGRLAVESLIRRWGSLSDGPDVDAETFALLGQMRSDFARLIDGDAQHVAFVPNTSYGLNSVLWGLNLTEGERILIAEVEFPAVVYVVQNIARLKGIEVETLPCPKGYLELDILEDALRKKASVLAISWVQYFNGYRYDLKSIAELCHAHGCFVLIDAIQGVGAVPMHVRDLGIDALACGAQKWLFGQTGSGFMYIAPETIRPVSPPFAGWLGVDWGYRFHDLMHADRPAFEDGRRWEIGTYPFFAVRLASAGLGLLAEVGTDRIWSNINARLQRLQDGLADSHCQFGRAGDSKNHSGIALLTGPKAADLNRFLSERRIHTAYREGNIRVAPHFYTKDEDIDCLRAAISEFEANQ